MVKKEKIIRDYFNSWVNKDSSSLREIFHEEIIYSECYGPVYEGIDCIINWFEDWNVKGDVLRWDIKRFINEGNTVVVEWYFKFTYKGENSEFDGVSIIDFNEENKIIRLKEFESKLPRYKVVK